MASAWERLSGQSSTGKLHPQPGRDPPAPGFATSRLQRQCWKRTSRNSPAPFMSLWCAVTTTSRRWPLLSRLTLCATPLLPGWRDVLGNPPGCTWPSQPHPGAGVLDDSPDLHALRRRARHPAQPSVHFLYFAIPADAGCGAVTACSTARSSQAQGRVDPDRTGRAIFARGETVCRIHLTQQVGHQFAPAAGRTAHRCCGTGGYQLQKPCWSHSLIRRGTAALELLRPLRRTVQPVPPDAGGGYSGQVVSTFCDQATQQPCSWPGPKRRTSQEPVHGACGRCAMKARGPWTPMQMASAR